jgi:hypothetical protein
MPIGDVLFLDLATQTGWAEGVPAGQPRYGSIRLAPQGATTSEIFGGLIRFLGQRLQAFPPSLVVFEAPMTPANMGGHTNIRTIRVLIGLVAVAEGVCNRMGVPVKEVTVGDVRQHFIGTRRLKSAEAKRAVIKQCRMLGYDPSDDNAADALAGWHYATAILDPRTAHRSTPLFGVQR